MPRESPDAPEDLPKEAPGQVTFGQLPNQSHSGSPIESQCGDVTGLFSRRLSPGLLDSVGAARAAGGELLLGVLGAEALARDLDEVGAVGQPVEGGGGQQRLSEELRPLGP